MSNSWIEYVVLGLLIVVALMVILHIDKPLYQGILLIFFTLITIILA